MNIRTDNSLDRASSTQIAAVAPARPVRGVEPVKAPPVGTPSTGLDTVSLSDRARELAAQSPAQGAAKVATLREAVQAGTLAVDAHAIAARLLGDHDD